MKLTDVEKMMFANDDESDDSSDGHNNDTIHSQANQRCVSVRDEGPQLDSNENSFIRVAPPMSVTNTSNSRPQRKSKSKTNFYDLNSTRLHQT